jgi:hypothetical protein
MKHYSTVRSKRNAARSVSFNLVLRLLKHVAQVSDLRYNPLREALALVEARMRPKIEDAWFGSITVEGNRYEHDIIIRLSGKVRRRNKQLSKAVYGTSHILSLAEIKDLHRKRAERLIIGAGFEGQAHLSPEAAEFLEKKGCRVDLSPTPEAIACWNEAEGNVIALFHLTC